MRYLGRLLRWKWTLLGAGAVAASLFSPVAAAPVRPRCSHGPFLGDVTANAAIVWARTEGLSTVALELRQLPEGPIHRALLPLGWDGSGALRHRFTGLAPDTEYTLRIDGLEGAERRFRTAAAATASARVTVAFGGDMGGQRFGRDEADGMPICQHILARRPDIFVGLGDMIYGDKSVPRRSPVGNRQIPLENGLLVDAADYHRSWRYLHDDAGFAALLAATSYVATWDDHECVNNFGPDDSWGLLADARQAMFAWNPLWGTADEPERLYRSIRWGRHLELFVLDTRSYRALTDLADDQTEPKSMLGKSQRDWLLAALAASDATWRVIVSSVPLTAPTGDAFKGRDGWSNDGSATGYERELLDLLRGMQQLGIRQPLFLVADVHHAEVLSLQPFADDPGFRPLEIVVGPMNAGCFGRERLDPTLRPTTLFYLGPDHDPRTRAEVLGLWNFGLLTVAADGSLQLAIVDANGAERFQLALQP